MATGSGVNQNKTAFVEEFLTGNPAGSFASANAAWKSAGNDGTVSKSLVNQARSRLKLTRKKGANRGASWANAGPAARDRPSTRTKTKAASKSKAGEVQSTLAGRESGSRSGKSAFVEETLRRDPKANVKAINRAWEAAGNDGTISDSVVYKIKRELGVMGLRSLGGSSQRAASPGNDSPLQANDEHASPTSTSPMASRGNGHARVLDEIEGEIDELMFQLKSLGGFDDVQEALRTARRLLVRSHGE